MKKLAGLIIVLMIVALSAVNVFAAEDTQMRSATIENLPDSDELFAGYVNEVFGIEDEDQQEAPRLRRVALDSQQQAMYNYLKTEIALVANGQREDASFDLDDNIRDEIRYTASDLGVSSVISQGSITQEAMDELGYRLSVVMNALLADSPYELYWFDKTIGYQYSFAWDSTNPKTVWIQFVVMSVAEAYRIEEENHDPDEPYYQVDEDKTGAASTAAANAQNVVDAHVEKLDYDKLSAYKDYIIGATDYNDAAAQGGIPYGDPWQLIWVFDGDPATKVVCEGYSKAFQYLCSKSIWHDKDFVCRSVTGLMDGGRHEWNVVTLGGANYLIDVTNSDWSIVEGPEPGQVTLNGSPGCAGQLFMKAPSEGDVQDGYTFSWDNYEFTAGEYTFGLDEGSVKYVYDSEGDTMTTTVYDESELTLADQDYDSSGEHHDFLYKGKIDMVGTYECSVCGFEETRKISAEYGASLTLEDNININLYVDQLSDPEHPERYWISSIFAIRQFNEMNMYQNLSEAEHTENGYKTVVAKVFPYQMTIPADICICYGNTWEEARTSVIYSFPYSASTYFNNKLNDTSSSDELKKLCYAALVYGGSSQRYFQDKTYYMANGNRYDYDIGSDFADLHLDTGDPINPERPTSYSTKVTGSIERFRFRTASLILGSEVSLKVFFDYDGDYSDLTITAVNIGVPNNHWYVPETERVVERDHYVGDSSSGQYAFRVPGIKSFELSDEYRITVTKGDQSTTLTYSPYTYANNKWESRTVWLQDLVRSIVAYGDAADKYFGKIIA